jgi:Trk K+ transport system NAD-binding subunit
MNSFSHSPWRNLGGGLVYMVVVIILASSAYVYSGWSWADAFYFVIITVFTVGYGELHPILTPELRLLTIGTIVMGCTGVIFLTGALVQFITFSQLQQLLGSRRLKTQIEKMSGHIIVCGYGRIGEFLAEELKAGGVKFVILDMDEERLTKAAAHGHPTWAGDASDEKVLLAVGVMRARALATVVHDDAINVFITLTARNLNKNLEIIARGVLPRTKGKLLQAGANSVVAPTHIGAEHIAQLILFPRAARFAEGVERFHAMAGGLRSLGLELEVVPVAPDSKLVGASVANIERNSGGGLFVIAVNRKNGETLTRPDPSIVVEAGDGVVLLTRTGRDTPGIS